MPIEPAPAKLASLPYAKMLGARLSHSLPFLRRPSVALEKQEQGLFLLWLAYMGLMLFAAYVLWRNGIFAMVVEGDPSLLSSAILLLFFGSSLWVGWRAWALGQARLSLQALRRGQNGSKKQPEVAAWLQRYTAFVRQGGSAHTAMALLGEYTHGPHEMAWWLNGIQLKLGLLGKVIGFSVMAMQLGSMSEFNPSQSALILKNLTGGLGIALLATMVGLATNMLLGFQLMRLDRYADTLVVEVLEWTHMGHSTSTAEPAVTGAFQHENHASPAV